MNKIWIVLRHELLTIITKPSFWIGLLVVPVISGVIFGVIALSSVAAVGAASSRKNVEVAKPQGYVDSSGIVDPQYITGTTPLQGFPDTAAAQAALDNDRISGYYLVPANVITSGQVKFISKAFSPFEDMSKTDQFQRVLELSLVKGDAQLLDRLASPVNIESRTSLAPASPSRGGSGELGFSPLALGACVLFFMVLITASSYLMNTVTTEKENRVMEVLMSSASPVQLLAGKILGLGFMGLIQLLLWLISALTILQNPLVASYVGTVTTGAVLGSVVYFVLGYLIYASLMAGLGALMPGTKEASQYSFFVMLPLMIPMYLNSAISREPSGMLATVLSLVPFTAPVVMPMRLVAAGVPVVQYLAGLVLLVIAVLGTIAVVSRIFRAQALLSGSKPNLRQLLASLKN